jgi:hypothetical protein
MRVAIVGSRGITDYELVKRAVGQSGFLITSVISGGAIGVDSLARQYAWIHGLPFTEYPADWDKYGKRGGFIRNNQMADEADAVISIWDGESRGTAHMLECAVQRKLPTYVCNTIEFSLRSESNDR